MLDIRDLAHPIIQAPMAGPATPELVAAVSNAGGLGFLAAGYRQVDDVRDEVSRTRALTAAPFGVNVLVPRPSTVNPAELSAYARELNEDARRLHTEPGEPRFDADSWDAKLQLLLELRPAVASFTFGSPKSAQVHALQDAGIAVAVTVTTIEEADDAVAGGADVLIVQGPDAGGHRGTWDPGAEAGSESLSSLLSSIREETTLPLVAAGGIGTAHHIDHVRRFGAHAVQLGTAFLLAEEAGTSAVHRSALTSPKFTETVVTRAFTGRWARALENSFTRKHNGTAPQGYPQVHHLTAPLRAASLADGNPEYAALWAGTRFKLAQSGSASSIIRYLLESDLG